jgi:hypothetical protein
MKKNHRNTKVSHSEQCNVDECVPVAPVEPHLPGRRCETRLQLPAGQPDLEALRSVTREWLVPLLVEKFLREQGIELRGRPNVGPGKTPISDPWTGKVTREGSCANQSQSCGACAPALGSATSQVCPEANPNLPGGSQAGGLGRGAECQRRKKQLPTL